MSLFDQVSSYAQSTFSTSWSTTEGRKIPTSESTVGLGNQAVRLDAVIFYADLADSTAMVSEKKWEFSAEVYKVFVYAAAKCVRNQGGEVTAYDGDRVMGVFIGGDKESRAVRAAFELKGLIDLLIEPEMRKWWSGDYQLSHKVGIDSSFVHVANTGIRGNNDYVWVGNAANNAAKMAALSAAYSTYITRPILDGLERSLSHSSAGGSFFTGVAHSLGYSVFGSNAYMEF